ncbi:MAG: IS5/IS1182 family transposase [Desulfobacteraceae bacterium]|nr:MAG: IS5/IS1182 family transposase [Desulfobacteraceae bacterium]
MSTLFEIWNTIQTKLFPWLEQQVDPLSDKEREFVEVVCLLDLPSHMKRFLWRGFGRKKKSRISMAKAFIAKAVYNFETTDMLIEYLRSCKNLRRLCGWEMASEIPSSATFCRAFAEFATQSLPQRIHEAMVIKHCGEKLAGHISRDSTAIDAREKPLKTDKQETVPKPKGKRGRPRKGEDVTAKAPRRVELQVTRSLEENLKDLPTHCNVGTKKNSKGYKETWIGYKLHLDCIDGDIPVSTILSSASLHDSQAAIPLSQMSYQRVTNLYDLMDAAYDSPQIHSFSKALGHIPIIDSNPRRGEKILMEPATKCRFSERSAAERVNSNLKDNYGGRSVRVKGASKVMAHLMFGVVSITAMQILRLLL